MGHAMMWFCFVEHCTMSDFLFLHSSHMDMYFVPRYDSIIDKFKSHQSRPTQLRREGVMWHPLKFEICFLIIFYIWDFTVLFFEKLRSIHSLMYEICIFFFFEIRFEIVQFYSLRFEIVKSYSLNCILCTKFSLLFFEMMRPPHHHPTLKQFISMLHRLRIGT